MGERTVAQDALFYSFNLERHVPAEHMLRSIAGSWISPSSASICGPIIAKRAGIRSIRSC
jgi:hypothetical protein